MMAFAIREGKIIVIMTKETADKITKDFDYKNNDNELGALVGGIEGIRAKLK